ncbi:sugar phosphate nucleotidyltransferase [Fonticella tunisiensis]|uniref:CTP:phosphocholine cytidylyltransferase-like protein n=1 Tax=Fonticella tunisiensis TaxID=1096341 RepID=A0A4R7K9P1_9CLOT|nr:sugar phosphate nucleotidyltransferase [Fonticella tunisiensis]TDT50830.1 CTP:phosphocholine cytidylyltransferase-like protein [Fonticella tunisiensis]
MRAIILAAGMGTRLRPLTYDTPKSLVKVAGEPMAERQIRFLKEKGIDDIIVVTGYLKEKFEYLRERYGVKLIHNDKYDVYNNVYTMYLVREYLEDAYVTEADVYMCRNYFENHLENSTYFGGIKEGFESEWKLHFDEDGRVFEIEVGGGTDYIMSGISYWTRQDGQVIRKKLEEVVEGGNFDRVYWDDVVGTILGDVRVYIKKIDSNDWFEIDSLEDLKKAENYILGKNV